MVAALVEESRDADDVSDLARGATDFRHFVHGMRYASAGDAPMSAGGRVEFIPRNL
jgi:hypothetical protein